MSHSKFYIQKLLLRNRKGVDEKLDRFFAGINCLCSMYVKYLDKWMKPVKDFSCFVWMTFSDPLNLSGVELYIQFLINNGLLVDDVSVLINLVTPELTWEVVSLVWRVHQFASTPEVDQVLLKLKKWLVPLRILEDSRGL